MAIGEPFTREITVKVKKSEQEQKKDDLVQVDRQLREVAEDKATEMADFNEQLKRLREKQRKLLDVIRDGEETVTVECREEADERRLEVKIVRIDTGEVIDRRPMTLDERQLSLSEVVPPAKAKRSRKKASDGEAAAT